MKKLLLLSFFILGLAIAVQAQVMFYQINNNSTTNSWSFGMADVTGNSVVELDIPPTQTRTGFMNPANIPPLDWKAENSVNCGGGGTIAAFGPGILPLSSCFSTFPGPPSITYNLTSFGPGFYNITINLP